MVQTNSPYAQWEIDVTEAISEQIGCTYSDASGIIETQTFYLRQAWGMGLNASDAAKQIITKSTNNA